MPKNSKDAERTGFQLRDLADASSAPDQASGEFSASSDFNDLGDLPRTYGEDIIFLIAQEPHWLFTYWDIDISRHPGGPTYLKYCSAKGLPEGEIEVPFETRNWYIPVNHADHDYFVEIGFYRAGQWNVIARSMTVRTPAEGLSSSDDFAFATIPFHLSFQRLVENLESALRAGDSLVETIGRLQKSGDFSGFGALNFGQLAAEDQFALIAALVGPDFLDELSSQSLSSEELHSRLHSYLTERLSSGFGGSSSLTSATSSSSSSFAGPTAEALSSASALSSGLLAAVSSWSNEQFTSWVQAALGSWTSSGGGSESWQNLSSTGAWESLGVSSWTSQAITSWLAGVESSGATTGSWFAAAESTTSGGLLSSWFATAQSSGIGAALSSWLTNAESSGTQALAGSWAQAVNSSWAQAGTASLSAAALGGWSSGDTSSWGGSDSGSSFSSPAGGNGSSSPHTASPAGTEIIFQGGTAPHASLTIGGQPVAVEPDGSFHCRVLFASDGVEIPIVATAPDGTELLSATLQATQKPTS